MEIFQSEGHLAIPKTSNGGKVLVLHAWWGLNETIKDFCNRLAQEGFTVYAPDLYHGKLADTISAAEDLSTSLSESQSYDILDIATKFLVNNSPHSPKGIAVIGFSMGAYFALDLSTRTPQIFARWLFIMALVLLILLAQKHLFLAILLKWMNLNLFPILKNWKLD